MTAVGPAVCLTIDVWCLEQSVEDMTALRAASEDGLVPFPVPVEVM